MQNSPTASVETHHPVSAKFLGCDEPGLGEEVGVERRERFAAVFGNDERKPVYQGIVHAFVRAEAGKVDSA